MNGKINELADKLSETEGALKDCTAEQVHAMANDTIFYIKRAKTEEELMSCYSEFVNDSLVTCVTDIGLSIIREIAPDVTLKIDNQWYMSYKEEVEGATEKLSEYAFDKQENVEKEIEAAMEYLNYIVDEESYNTYIDMFRSSLECIPTAKKEVLNRIYTVNRDDLTDDEKFLFDEKVNELTVQILDTSSMETKNSILDSSDEEVANYIKNGKEEIERLQELNKRRDEVKGYVEKILEKLKSADFGYRDGMIENGKKC